MPGSECGSRDTVADSKECPLPSCVLIIQYFQIHPLARAWTPVVGQDRVKLQDKPEPGGPEGEQLVSTLRRKHSFGMFSQRFVHWLSRIF